MEPAVIPHAIPLNREIKRSPAIRIYRVLSHVGSWKRACVLSIALFTIGFRLALTHVLPHPQPSIQDEFSYLLGADIFAHGRVAEPSHSHWKFFESVYVIARPVYAPKYPPAQSAFLALGQVVFHDPFYGVLLSVALFSGAMCWMLQAYVRSGWALLGGLSTALYFGAGHYWTESYWGGAVAGLGAALLVGAFGRLRTERSMFPIAALGMGALLLMTSRPYESSVLIVILCAALMLIFWKRWRWASVRMALPILASLGLAAFAVLVYNHSVTGNAFKLPYVLYMGQYGTAPMFWPQPPAPPRKYENAAIEASAALEAAPYLESRALPVTGHLAENLVTIFATVLADGGGLILTIVLLVPLFRNDPTVRLFTWCACALLGALLMETFMLLHYMAPLIVVVVLLACLVLDRLWRFHKTQHRILQICVLSSLMIMVPAWRAVRALAGHPAQLYSTRSFGFRRAEVVQTILSHPGSHVVFVRFTPEQRPDDTWVANGADIDGARLVWAHHRGPENRELQEYFRDRTFWSLEDRAGKITLTPYRPEVASR